MCFFCGKTENGNYSWQAFSYGNWIRNLKKETSTGIDSVFLLDGDYYGNFEILFPPMI